MLDLAQLGRSRGGQAQRIASLPAPVKGWNTRDALSDMAIEHAVVLDNWLPANEKIALRKGYKSHATGLSPAVESLMEYVSSTGAGKLFAASGTTIHDVTSAGAVGAAAVSGLTNARWQHVNMGTSGGRFLLCFNGADTPRTFDGTSWANAGMTGPAIANCIWCNTHQRRLWIGEEDSMSAWYGGTNAITGAFTEFPLYGIARRGGYLMGMATWTRDSGDGMDDVAVFMTSEGEAIVYSGIDPASASTWALIGVFDVGKPLGRRFWCKAGGDVMLLLRDGFVPLSRVLLADRSQVSAQSISDQISPTFAAAARDHGGKYGWQPTVYPAENIILANIPISAGLTSHQYVFNTLTGAPCRFTGLNAACWSMLGNDLYFGHVSDGKVYKALTGTDDNDANIPGDVMQAFSYFGLGGTIKQFLMARPTFSASSVPSVALDFNVDFNQNTPAALASTIGGSEGLWDTAVWDTAVWGQETQIYAAWKSIVGIGRSGALRTRVSVKNISVALLATDIAFTTGAGL